MAIFYAVCNLFFAALNDLVFKGYARKPRPQGFFVSIVGVMFLATSLFFINGVADWRATVIWGCVSGFFSIGGNLLMLDAMKKLDAGICSTIYRLNLVPAVIMAAFLLGEKISPVQYVAIGCACLAVLAFLPRSSSMRREMGCGIAVMIIASLMRAGMGISYRYGFINGADENMVPVINAIFWIVGGIIYAFTRERDLLRGLVHDSDTVKKIWRYGLLSGFLVSAIVVTMARALANGEASVVLPIMQMSFLLTGVLSVIFLKEKITLLKVAALLLGVTAVLLLSIKF